MNKDLKYFTKYLDTYHQDEWKYVSEDSQIRIKTCPFCGDERNKVYYGVESGWGDCKYCNEIFRALKFVMYDQDVDKEQAINILYGQDIHDDFILQQITKTEEQERPKEPVFLPAGELALDNLYLFSRGLNNEIIKKFNIIQCTHGRFAGRVVFPIYDIDNNLITYQGRDYTGTVEKKYLFPKGFDSKVTLYNIWNINKQATYIIITEGVFDCLGWYVKGYTNVVATFGKSISDYQIQLLRDLEIKTIYFAWDFDAIPEIIKAYRRYSCYFEQFKIIIMPPKLDADELNKNILDKLFQSAIEYDWQLLMEIYLKFNKK